MAEGESTSNTRQHGLSDKEIHGIARSIASDDKITELGLQLGIPSSDVNRYLKTNRMDGEVTSKGTNNMIQQWKETIQVEDQRSALRKALMEVKLIAIADLYIPDVLIPMTARQVRQTREDLINHYKEHDFKIKTSPLDPDAYVDLDKMYTCTSFKLVVDNNNRRKMKTKMTKEQNQIPIEYKGIINYKVKGKKALRMVCVGEAGVGKSTLLAKMAHDWATAKSFTDITLLFLVHLRKTEGVRSLGEIVKAYLSAANEVTPMQLDDYANNNLGKLKTISIRRMDVNSRALDAFVTAPSIRELSLHKIRVDGSDQVDVLVKQRTAQVCHVTKLTIDDESLLALNRLNFAAKTPMINDVTLECYRDELTGDVIDSLKFPLLQKLALMTSSPNGTDLRESDPLARALAASWPVLTRLEIARIFMDDAQIETILGKVRRHRYLKSIRLDRCCEGCDDGDVIDTLLDEIKEEGQIDIEIIKASDEDLMVSDSDDEYERGHVESFDSVLYGEFDNGDEFHDNDDEGDNYDDLSDESVDADDGDSSDDE